MKKIIFLAFFLLPAFCYSQPDTSQLIIPGRKNSLTQQQKPYVILISSDGFRHDYAQKFNATNLLSFGREGVRAESMIPSFPSLTFPNHYAIITGQYPAHNGLVGNSYYDRERAGFYLMSDSNAVRNGDRYGGTPLWVLAEKQQMLAASFYWVGSEAAIQGVRPTYYYNYNEQIPIDKRIQIVSGWLNLPAEERPHFITFYLPETDHEGHAYGPDAKQTKDAVLFVDNAIKRLTEEVQKTGLPVNYIFLADHGMTNVNTLQPILLEKLIDTNKFIVNRGNQIFQLYAKDKKYIKRAFKTLKHNAGNFKVYKKNKMPARYHYRRKDDYYNRIGDIILLPDWPNVFSPANRKIQPGAHGYDPRIKDMQTVFYAWGPAFKTKMVIPSFENIHVYPLIARILGLAISERIDGNIKVGETLLK